MKVSAPFASREFHGELLLEELEALREGGVRPKHLYACAAAMRQLEGLKAAVAAARLKKLAAEKFREPSALGSLLVRWSVRLKTEGDVLQLSSHLRRLAVTSALLLAMRQGADRLKPKGNAE